MSINSLIKKESNSFAKTSVTRSIQEKKEEEKNIYIHIYKVMLTFPFLQKDETHISIAI